MISYLRGKLLQRTPTYITVDVGGVGYGVSIPLKVFYRLPPLGSEVELYIYTLLQRDGMSLYGFLDPRARDLFGLLLTVKGVGPKVALTLLSGMDVEEVEEALLLKDKERLGRVPGIGQRTAERMIFELSRKLTPRTKEPHKADQAFQDALAALVRLGYPKGEAQRALERASLRKGTDSLEELLKEALRELYQE